jgi:hypothetical protein
LPEGRPDIGWSKSRYAERRLRGNDFDHVNVAEGPAD